MTLAVYLGGPFAAIDTNPPDASTDMLAEAKARAAWTGAVDALGDAIPRVARLDAQVQELNRQGRWSGKLDTAIADWVTSVQKLLGSVVGVIEVSPGAQSAVDAQIAAVTGSKTVTQGAWREFVADLKPPATQPGLGFWQLIASTTARVFSNPAVWAGAKELLLKMGPWVAGTIISKYFADALNTGAKSAKEKGANLENCLQRMQAAESETERAAIERLCSGANEEPSDKTLWLLLGASAVVAGLFYWQNRRKLAVVSPVGLAGLSGVSRRRRYGQAR